MITTSIEEQIKLFTGCVYVLRLNKVRLPDGKILGKVKFNMHFNGYLFAINATGSKHTQSAWFAFTRNECFRPPIDSSENLRPVIDMDITR